MARRPRTKPRRQCATTRHRDRHLRPDRGAGRPLLGRADRSARCENFRIGAERMPLPLIRALGVVKRAAAEVNHELGLLDARRAQRDRQRRAGGDRRQARRPFPAGGLADRLRHPDQHERQRGDRQPRQRDARRQARREGAGASERSRQHEPVVERLLPDRDAHRRGRARSRARCCRRSRICAARSPAKAEAVRPHRQDRPHPPAGCDAAHARPGILRLCRAGRERHRAHRAGAARSSIRWRRAAPRSAPGSTPSRASPTLLRQAGRRAHRPAVRQRAEQVRGAGRARRLCVRARRAQRARDRPVQDRQRHPPARLRPALRPRRARACRRTSPAPRSCPARSIRPSARR